MGTASESNPWSGNIIPNTEFLEGLTTTGPFDSLALVPVIKEDLHVNEFTGEAFSVTYEGIKIIRVPKSSLGETE